MSLVWSLDRVTQVAMDGLLSFPFCGKKVILNTLGRISRSYELYAHCICFIGLKEKNCFKMEWVLALFLYGTKSRENNGPNGYPAQCMTPSEFHKIRYKQRYWKAANWILCLFLLWLDNLPLVTLVFICGKHFEFFQASSDSVGQNRETTITSFKIAR